MKTVQSAMNPSHRHNPIQQDEYFSLEAQSPIRHELIGGQLYAMMGDSAQHNTIVTNLTAIIKSHLSGQFCRVFSSTFKLAVGADFYYPGVFVTCSQPHRHYSDAATLVIEVLSDSTQHYDRTEKIAAYKRLASLEEYCLIAQDRPSMVLYSRSNQWTPKSVENVITFESIDLSVPMPQIYESVFEP